MFFELMKQPSRRTLHANLSTQGGIKNLKIKGIIRTYFLTEKKHPYE